MFTAEFDVDYGYGITAECWLGTYEFSAVIGITGSAEFGIVGELARQGPERNQIVAGDEDQGRLRVDVYIRAVALSEKWCKAEARLKLPLEAEGLPKLDRGGFGIEARVILKPLMATLHSPCEGSSSSSANARCSHGEGFHAQAAVPAGLKERSVSATQLKAICLEASVEGCDAEVYLNGVPLGRIFGDGARANVFGQTVNDYVVDGPNRVELLIDPGERPSQARTPRAAADTAGVSAWWSRECRRRGHRRGRADDP